METKKKKNRIILCLCSILVLFASVFAFIPMNKDSKTVYADTVYENAYFRGSPVTFTTSMYEYYYNTNNQVSSVYLSGLSSYEITSNPNYSYYFKFLYSVLTVHLRYNANGVVEFLPMLQHPEVVDGQGYASTNGVMNLYDYTFINVNGTTLEDCRHWFNGYISNGNAYGQWFATDGSTGVMPHQNMLFTEDLSSYNGGYFYELNQRLSGVFMRYHVSSTPIKIEKINRVRFSGDCVRYLDVYDNYIEFVLLSKNYLYQETTYYFANDLFTDNEYYKAGYDGGYADGYEEGEIKGEDSGYRDGFIAGEDSGYWDGYEQALENDDRYNFTNLIASVIDVPVKTFTSLFNFEILGVNLSGFFLGLLTCCIVIGVIRLIL